MQMIGCRPIRRTRTKICCYPVIPENETMKRLMWLLTTSRVVGEK